MIFGDYNARVLAALTEVGAMDEHKQMMDAKMMDATEPVTEAEETKLQRWVNDATGTLDEGVHSATTEELCLVTMTIRSIHDVTMEDAAFDPTLMAKAARLREVVPAVAKELAGRIEEARAWVGREQERRSQVRVVETPGGGRRP